MEVRSDETRKTEWCRVQLRTLQESFFFFSILLSSLAGYAVSINESPLVLKQ